MTIIDPILKGPELLDSFIKNHAFVVVDGRDFKEMEKYLSHELEREPLVWEKHKQEMKKYMKPDESIVIDLNNLEIK
jgi:hypothetical protein